jgi:hypothetical protein
MPDYIITIYLKVGKPKMGVRWHPSYDLDQVHALVEKKVQLALGTAIVEKVDVDIAPQTFGKKSEAKALTM